MPTYTTEELKEQLADFKRLLLEKGFTTQKADETLAKTLSLIIMKTLDNSAKSLSKEQQTELVRLTENKDDEIDLLETLIAFINKNTSNQSLEEAVKHETDKFLTEYSQQVFGKTI